MQSPPTGVKVKLIDDNDLYKWEIQMDGPEQSVYAVRSHHRSQPLLSNYPTLKPHLPHEQPNF